MLDPAESAAVAAAFGVADTQVRRDHLLSHLLGALSSTASDAVVFFGGTALARTYLPDGRLSEDLDLLAVDSRATAVGHVQTVLSDGSRREFGRLTWTPNLASVRDVDPAVLSTAEGLTDHAVDPIGWPRPPTSMRGTARPGGPLRHGSSTLRRPIRSGRHSSRRRPGSRWDRWKRPRRCTPRGRERRSAERGRRGSAAPPVFVRGRRRPAPRG